MKNTVKFLSMMFAAGAMMFASCEPDPDPESEPRRKPKKTSGRSRWERLREKLSGLMTDEESDEEI